MICQEGRSSHSQIPRARMHTESAEPRKKRQVQQETEMKRGECGLEPVWGFPGKAGARQGRCTE